jgi:hypothetical protein
MKAVRKIAITALLFLGISSCVGGVPLILDPSGGILKMPLTLLHHSPFHSFLVPGLVLLFFNGILSVAIIVPVLRKAASAGLWVAFQGCVLFGWISIEVIMIRTLAWPHFLYWGVSLVLVLCGWALHRHQGKAPTNATLPAASIASN